MNCGQVLNTTRARLVIGLPDYHNIRDYGAVQARVAHQAYAWEKGLRDGSIKKVGVNLFEEEEELI